MDKNILLINDMAGYGKVALSVMIPILSHMKYQVYNLPTALVSNTLDYGKFDILETTDYMKNSMRIWDELGFSFDAVSTGFLISEEQTRIVADYCRKMHRNGTYIFVDPIMGDNGKLYNGVTSKTIEYMRKMCSVAHIVMPNFTEAAFLADMYREKQALTREEAEKLLNTIHGMGAGSVVVTSADVEGKSATLVYDEKDNNTYTIPYDEIPIRFPGTGDIFASVLIGNYLTGRSLKSSVKSAMKTIEKLIALNRDNLDKYKGIPIERYLEEIIYEQTEN